MSKLQGVFWDLDGTIANTEFEGHLPAFNNAFNDLKIGWFWDADAYVDLLKVNGGKNRIAHYSEINNFSITSDLVIKIHERKQHHYLNNIRNNSVSLKSGVYRLIKNLNDNNVRQFIVTSSSREQAELLIFHLFKDFNPFEFIISSDDVIFHKPHPYPYIKAINLSGINKNNLLVFEDSNAGIRSSLAAEINTIYTPSNVPTNIDKEFIMNCIINNFGDDKSQAEVIKGPKLEGKYIDFSYLNNYLQTSSNAKD